MHLHATIVQELSDQEMEYNLIVILGKRLIRSVIANPSSIEELKAYNNTTIIFSVARNFIKYNFTREYLTGWIR